MCFLRFCFAVKSFAGRTKKSFAASLEQMKKIISVVLILFSTSFVFGQGTQQKPLSQAEYVKMLYDLQKNPGKKDELVEVVRRRGIGFELTDGLRGLTTSKSRNDTELKRTLEEAARRRQNPEKSQLPTEKEAAEILKKAHEATLAAVEEMPDFTVKQLVSRGVAYAGTNNWKSIDKLTIAVNYSTTKGENYKVLAINGAPVNAEGGSNYAGLGGATTGGEFASNLAKVFQTESKTKFIRVDTDVLRNRKAIVYQYEIALENYKSGVGYKGAVLEEVATGQKGKIWIDRENFRVLRIEYKLTDIPPNFPIKALEKTIDYDWVEIAEQKYLLPALSDARFTTTSEIGLLQDRNLIRFKNYQKYGSEVKILDDDETAPEEKKPNQ
jgi:hypothetical protein